MFSKKSTTTSKEGLYKFRNKKDNFNKISNVWDKNNKDKDKDKWNKIEEEKWVKKIP